MKSTTLMILTLSIASIVTGKEITFDEGIKFTLPNEFVPAPSPAITKLHSKNSSCYIKKTETRDISILFSVTPSLPKNNPLEDLRKTNTEALPRMTPQFECKQNEIIDLNERKWYCLDVISHSKEKEVRNIMMTTVYNDRLITFSFNCTAEQFRQYEATFKACMKSITFES